MQPDADVILDVRDLEAYYGESKALHGVTLEIRQGELVTLLGRNGAGKSTTLKCIMGAIPRRYGSILLRGAEVISAPSNKIARMGVAWCPENRGIFSSLSVEENLLLPPIIAPGGLSVEEIYTLFPNLAERRRSQGTRLSGGEQQMLAIGRILRTGARFLLMDEPTEGLAPVIIQKIGDAIRLLKERGYTILLVEQNFHFASSVADRHYVMEDGLIAEHILAADIGGATERLHEYLAV